MKFQFLKFNGATHLVVLDYALIIAFYFDQEEYIKKEICKAQMTNYSSYISF